MTKTEYVTELLSDVVPLDITVDKLKEIAKDIVDGLDMWYELSGDSVATSNRYAAIENEKEQRVKDARKELEKEERKHKEEVEEIRRNVRWMRQRYQNEIDELKKQIR